MREQGRYAEALAVWRGEASTLDSTAYTLHHLGDTHLAAGAPAQAREVWEQAVEIDERLGHAGIAKARRRLTGWAATPSSG
ncbi:tetratricopeptide repeat protein [Nocardia sp. NRRL S-836]|uniref:tetratricopeptide repeat protein n=1 Tax=Nocardia sp. NRRL S-836 TaxID=1519492 RepID=UPI0006AE3B4C|nr:tetratricopeptide repeat protein [Nocardia sp. NRRL S-836]KOV84486.1 hypothetical protein ADL03_16475 [Nocardia sp. NRRL S-836]